MGQYVVLFFLPLYILLFYSFTHTNNDFNAIMFKIIVNFFKI